MIIYLITNTVNGKQYVGQTVQSLKNRWKCHKSKSGCTALKSAILKYGSENFTIEIIFRASSLEQMAEKEKEMIVKLSTLAPNGYNLTTGGERPVMSNETRRKMSLAKAGKTLSISHKTAISNSGKQSKGEIHRSSMSSARIGKPHPIKHPKSRKNKSIDINTGEEQVFISIHSTKQFGYNPKNIDAALRRINNVHKNKKWEFL